LQRQPSVRTAIISAPTVDACRTEIDVGFGLAAPLGGTTFIQAFLKV
jgi:hypothetical protein